MGIWEKMGRSTTDAFLPLITILLLCKTALSQQNVTDCTTGTIYPNELDNTKFYVCYNGVLRSQNCPANMRFDSTQGFCSTGAVGGGTSCGDIPHGGFSPSQNLEQFYVCNNGKFILQKCPYGQTFNPMLGYCTTGQINPPPPPPPPPPPTLPNLNCGPYTQGQFVADFSNPTRYFVCVLGKLRPQVCPAGKTFDKDLLTCVVGTTTPQPGTCGPYLPNHVLPICEGLAAGESYLICTLGVFLIQPCGSNPPAGSGCKNAPAPTPQILPPVNCQSGLVYDPTVAACVNPFGAVTGQYAANPNDPTSYFVKPSLTPVKCPTGYQFFQALDTNNPPCTEVPLPPGPPGASYAVVPLILKPMNPPPTVPGYTQYYVLYNNGLPMVQRCPDGFIVFQGQCMKLTRTSRALVALNEKPCKIEQEGKYLPVTDDCQKFQVCFNSKLIEHACPDGQYFDGSQGVCTINRGQCQQVSTELALSRSKRSVKQSRTAESSECFGKHGVFTPDPFDCRRFYACINGWKIGQSCQDGEAYDPKTQSCTLDYEEICPTYSAVNVFLEKLEQVSTGSEVSEQTRADVSCSGRELGEFLANPDDCTSYFVCSNGFAIPKQCPAEHYFDRAKHICRPNDGTCDESHELVESAESPIYLAASDNTSICTGKHGIIVPDPEDCTSFFLCIYGRAHHDRCYDGEYFDSQQRHCTVNHGLCTIAAEKTEQQSNEASEVVEEKHLTNACNGYFDGTHLPNPDNCHNFFVCIDGIPIPEQCGDNEFFDSVHGFCRQNQDGADSCSNMISEKSVCYGKHGIHVEHQDDCRKYYLCVNGQALVHDCNVNEYFNKRLGACILDVDGKCPGTNAVPQKINEPVKEIISWNKVIEETKPISSSMESSEEKHQYFEYEQFLGKPVYQKPALHVYKPEKPKKSLPKCTRGMNEYVFYPNVNDNCRTFYECINGKPIIHSCPVGFVYNVVLNICDLPDFVECTHTMDIKETRDSSCDGAISGVRYANYEDGCKSFYVCSHGNAIHTYCGEGLLYNPIMGVCDWEANIQCTNGRERKRT